MKRKNNSAETTREEREIREWMQAARRERPSEALKERIMHQIKTEEALLPRKVRYGQSAGHEEHHARDFAYVFGGLYVLITAILAVIYLRGETEVLRSCEFYALLGAIEFFFIFLWLLLRIDGRTFRYR